MTHCCQTVSINGTEIKEFNGSFTSRTSVCEITHVFKYLNIASKQGETASILAFEFSC